MAENSLIAWVHEELVAALGFDAVSELPGRLGKSTGLTSTTPVLVTRPTTSEQVQSVVRIAARHGMPIYPVSRGNNWGYGDASAPTDGCVLVDLSNMRRIIEVNSELAYAVVEPGVSQQQLYEYIEEHDLPLWLDVVGSGPDASVVGNIMERGFGLGPSSDRAANACGMEVVLPDGRLLRTGLGAYPKSKAAHLFRGGPGPMLDGLFTQANLGIVTRLTFWLLPRPEVFRALFIRVRDEEQIGPLVEALRPLRLSGTLRCSVHCYNAMRLLGGLTRYPYDRADGLQALEVGHPELTEQLLRQHALPSWLAVGSLAGSKREVRAATATLKRALRKVPSVRLDLLDSRLSPLLRGFARAGGRFRKLRPYANQALKLAMLTEFLQGNSSYQTLVGSHWRARGEPGPDQDPRDSGSGMVWVSPVLPARAEDVAQVQALGRSCFHQHGFEYQVTISQISDRALCAVMSIHFDRTSEEESKRARTCHDALVDQLITAGYIPYRGHPLTIARVRELAPEYWEFVSGLKGFIDPGQTMAPGRYIPAES